MPIGLTLPQYSSRCGCTIRIAVNFARRCLKDAAFQPLGEAKHVDRAVHARLGGLHGVVLIVNWRGGTGEVIDFVDLDEERHRYVVPQELEARFVAQMFDIALGPGEQIVGAQDVVALA